MSRNRTKRGFTLVELLVVIGILGVLSAVLMGALSGSTDSARAALCLSNMKNLANACQSYGVAAGRYPGAGSLECFEPKATRRGSRSKMEYKERKGWISWFSENRYPAESHQKCPIVGMFSTDREQSQYAITNGAVWKYVSSNSKVYVCPLHVNKRVSPNWSYLMNARFGWDAADGSFTYPVDEGFILYGRLNGADRTLLFSEVPFQGPGDWFPEGEGASMDTDCILQYKGCNKAYTAMGKSKRDGNEHIGCNHKNGKYWYAHVVFADAHTEKLCVSNSRGVGISSQNLRDLTTWLCTGKEVSFDGTRYNEIKD